MHGDLVVVDDVAAAFTEHFVDAFAQRSNPIFSVALSGGETARRCYTHLAEHSDTVDWLSVDLYWGDERCVPLDHEDSNFCLARKYLMEPVAAVHTFFPMDCNEGASSYSLRLSSIDGLDLVHLGLGPDGHTASLFRDSPALEAQDGQTVAESHDPHGNNPYDRLTLTFSAIARARKVLVTVSGEAKAEAFARVRAGDATAPASLLESDNLVWLVDHAAMRS